MTLNLQNESQQVSALEARIDELEKLLKVKDGLITCLNETIISLKNQLRQQSEKRIELEKLLESKQKELFEAGGQNLVKDNLLEQRQAEISKYNNQIQQLRHRLLSNHGNEGREKEWESIKLGEATQNEKSVKFSSLQIYELDRLQKENKRLADENLKLSNELKQLSNDQFLTKTSGKTAFLTQSKGFSNDTQQPNQKMGEISKNDEPSEAKQEQHNQQVPKKRKLMRKPRIQVDIDTFEVTPVNI